MNENLLVNSKTDILEFKRKHNLLVAKGTIKANVSNVKELTNDVINNLRCGDIVLKEDITGKHAYLVSFKSDTGLCLTYCDASCIETQSYDKSGENWIYNSEDLTFINRFEQIVDAQGHNRFIEGDGIPLEQEGYTSVYCKWSLSGTHLMMVVAAVITEDTIIDNGSYLGSFKLPQWVFDKIYPVFGDELEFKEIYAYNDDWTSQNFNVDLNKSTNNTMVIRIIGNGFTATKDRQFRVQFDLLIDNEEPQGE